MNYGLAKKLRDAGFPQEGTNCDGYGDRIYAYEKGTPLAPDPNERCYIPSLEELVKECGDEIMLTNCNGGKWTAYKSGKGNIMLGCDTAAEAVANLYLKIHKP